MAFFGIQKGSFQQDTFDTKVTKLVDSPTQIYDRMNASNFKNPLDSNNECAFVETRHVRCWDARYRPAQAQIDTGLRLAGNYLSSSGLKVSCKTSTG